MVSGEPLSASIALVRDSTWASPPPPAVSWFARSPRRLSAVGGAGGLAMIGLV
jgi:hypothetical protein